MEHMKAGVESPTEIPDQKHEIVLKWSHSAKDFRNRSGRVSQSIFIASAEAASALPFCGPWHGAGWVPKPLPMAAETQLFNRRFDVPRAEFRALPR